MHLQNPEAQSERNSQPLLPPHVERPQHEPWEDRQPKIHRRRIAAGEDSICREVEATALCWNPVVPDALDWCALHVHEHDADEAHGAGAEDAEVQHPFVPRDVDNANQEQRDRGFAGSNGDDIALGRS